MEEAVLVLDVGKSRTKLHLVGRTGRFIAERNYTNRAVSHQSRKVLDADGIANWLLPQLCALSRIASVRAIVPVAHGAAAALICGDDLIAPVQDYESELPNGVARAYDALRDPFSDTLSPRLPGGLNLGAQLFWQDRLYPVTQKPGNQILLWPQYWARWLCGEGASEVTSLGCHTDMWRPRSGQYSILAISQGWNVRLPPLALASAVLGRVRSGIAREADLPRTCDVLCGLHDSNAALHALRESSRAKDARFCVVSTGTWFVAMQSGAVVLPELNPAFNTLANVDVEGRAVPTARFMGGRDFECITGADLGGPAAIEDAIALIARGDHRRIRYDSASDNFLTPSPAEITGLDARLKVAIASLYLALNTDAALDHIAASGPIYVEGRFASNEIFTAALAALRPLSPVHVCTATNGVALGAARLLWPDLPAAATKRVEPLQASLERGRNV